jgi:hypothetical protein
MPEGLTSSGKKFEIQPEKKFQIEETREGETQDTSIRFDNGKINADFELSKFLKFLETEKGIEREVLTQVSESLSSYADEMKKALEDENVHLGSTDLAAAIEDRLIPIIENRASSEEIKEHIQDIS